MAVDTVATSMLAPELPPEIAMVSPAEKPRPPSLMVTAVTAPAVATMSTRRSTPLPVAGSLLAVT